MKVVRKTKRLTNNCLNHVVAHVHSFDKITKYQLILEQPLFNNFCI